MSFKHYLTAFASSGDSIHTLMISKLQLLKLQQEEWGGGSAKALPQKQTYCEKQLKYTVQNGPVKNSKSKKQKPCYIITQLLQSHRPGWLGVKTKLLTPPKLADLQFYKQ